MFRNLKFLVFLPVFMAVAAQTSSAPPTDSPPPETLRLVQDVYSGVVDELNVRNDLHWHAGKYAEYVRICRLVAEIYPECEDAYSGGAWLMESLNRHDEGVAFLRLGISRNPKSCDLQFELAYFLFRHNRFTDALPYAEEGAHLDCSWHSWHLLAHTYERLGRREDAIKTWRNTIEKWPDDGAAKANLERLNHINHGSTEAGKRGKGF